MGLYEDWLSFDMTGFYFDAYCCIFGIISGKVEVDWNINIFNNWQEMDRSMYVFGHFTAILWLHMKNKNAFQ